MNSAVPATPFVSLLSSSPNMVNISVKLGLNHGSDFIKVEYQLVITEEKFNESGWGNSMIDISDKLSIADVQMQKKKIRWFWIVIDNLRPNVAVRTRFRASNGLGNSDWSGVFRVKSDPTRPNSPVNLRVVENSNYGNDYTRNLQVIQKV